MQNLEINNAKKELAKLYLLIKVQEKDSVRNYYSFKFKFILNIENSLKWSQIIMMK